MNTQELIDRYRNAFHGDEKCLDDMAKWYLEAKQFLRDADLSHQQSALIDLAYLVGRGEREFFTLLGHFNRCVAIRNGRKSKGNQDNPPEVKAAAVAMAKKLRQQGVRNFLKVTADEYDVTPKTIDRWMKNGS